MGIQAAGCWGVHILPARLPVPLSDMQGMAGTITGFIPIKPTEERKTCVRSKTVQTGLVLIVFTSLPFQEEPPLLSGKTSLEPPH